MSSLFGIFRVCRKSWSSKLYFSAINASRATERPFNRCSLLQSRRRVALGRKEYHREKRYRVSEREGEREKSMKKKKMLIGATCSVQQRVLTRLPGTWRALLLSFSFSLASSTLADEYLSALPARCRLSSKRGVSLELERIAIWDERRNAKRLGVRYTRDFHEKNYAKKRFKKTTKDFILLMFFFSPTYSPFPLLSLSLYPLIFRLFPFFSPSYIRMPVSWTFYKYLHEFRTTTRKIEKGKSRL